MFCTKCGKEIANSSKFCEFCGSEITERPSTVKVVFHRQKKFSASLVPMTVYIDKEKVASLQNDGTAEVDVPCGKHSLLLEMWSAVGNHDIEVSPEYKKIHIEIGMKMGVFTNSLEILSIKKEK